MDDKEHCYHDFDKQELTILNKWFWAFVIFCVGLFLWSLPKLAKAEEIPVHVIEHHQGVKMRLLPGPCVDPVSLAMIADAPPQFKDGWKAISSQWRMNGGNWQEFAGCWLEVDKAGIGTPENVMLLLFSDGAVVQLLKSELLGNRPGA
ncbi:MAG TPA: hypothetical protein VGK99_05470 [Acidobacteriota bacterium]|jgi:hypothetical protein